MSGKLGVHVQTDTPEAWALVRRVKPDVLKVLTTAVNVGELEHWRQDVGPKSILIYREFFELGEKARPEDRVALLEQHAAPIQHLVSYVEAPYNEEMQRAKEVGRYAELTATATVLLHLRGFRVAVGNFSAGCPALEDWPLFYRALEQADALSLHEYDYPSMRSRETWMCLRYRRIIGVLPDEYRKPILITECGLDSGDKRGWRTWQPDPKEYAKQLRWYRDEIEKDALVLGATLFTAGANPDWLDYAVEGVAEIEEVLTEVRPEVVIPSDGGNGGGNNMTLEEQFPDLFAAWKAAQGIESAFAAHLRGIGILPPDVTAAAANVESAWAQLKNQLFPV